MSVPSCWGPPGQKWFRPSPTSLLSYIIHYRLQQRPPCEFFHAKIRTSGKGYRALILSVAGLRADNYARKIGTKPMCYACCHPTINPSIDVCDIIRRPVGIEFVSRLCNQLYTETGLWEARLHHVCNNKGFSCPRECGAHMARSARVSEAARSTLQGLTRVWDR